MNKRFQGLKELPTVEGPILAGIATELMGVNPQLVVAFHKGLGDIRSGYQISPEQAKTACGFKLKLRKVVLVNVAIYGNVVHALYEWNGILIPSRPVPDKPGWVYRGRREDKRDERRADVQDPKRFHDWTEWVLGVVKERVDYLEGRRHKAAQEKADRAKQAQIAHEAHERWKARWAEIEANMYVI